MRIDLFGQSRTVDDAVASARIAAEAGMHTFWLPQIASITPLVTLAVAAGEIEEIRLGTAVVPVQTTHPVLLARQARTLSQVSNGRFTLGIGVAHRPIVEEEWGLPFDRPVGYLEEYLDVLLPLLDEQEVAATGERLSARATIDIPAPPVPVMLAALGPRMLDLAGRRTTGTITWMVGPRTLAGHTVPAITAASAAAGNPPPQIVAGYPVCVTDDPETARGWAARAYAGYGDLPSYRAMLDREGAAGPADLAVVGEAIVVREHFEEIFDAGATAITVSIFGPRPLREATLQALAAMTGG